MNIGFASAGSHANMILAAEFWIALIISLSERSAWQQRNGVGGGLSLHAPSCALIGKVFLPDRV
jgi:hypothetical protein